MTAINVVRTPHSVVVAVDSASYDPDTGEVLAFTSKAVAVPHWPGCVSTRGEALALPLLAFTLGNQFRDFDDLIARIEDEIEDVHDRILPLLEYPDMPIDIILAGWSKARRRGEAFYLRTGEQVFGMTDSEVTEAVAGGAILPDNYKLTEFTSKTTFGPDVPYAKRAAAKLIRDTDSMDEAETFAYLRAILELQRRDLFDPGDGGEVFPIVGGFAVASIIDASSVRQVVFHQWPQDKVGERIDSGSSLAAKEPEAPKLSKLRAEMLARKARKLARHG